MRPWLLRSLMELTSVSHANPASRPQSRGNSCVNLRRRAESDSLWRSARLEMRYDLGNARCLNDSLSGETRQLERNAQMRCHARQFS